MSEAQTTTRHARAKVRGAALHLMSRLSTSFVDQGVDGRDKPGHDDKGK
jgi:hypothetical protein